ncbi:hypothetical protein CSKR_106852 [Clonorchis sinensis]|uniref:Uncharacterized protein n=1 Tax=Clonorchis sinensis TaxID=79923 RepID=A0A419PUC3_CLOSI|nr:hypothetical protein CSKR_106852 [Clonorchis sinensis]
MKIIHQKTKRSVHLVRGNKYENWLSYGGEREHILSKLSATPPIKILVDFPPIPSGLTAVRQSELAHAPTPSGLSVCDEFENLSLTRG